MYKVIKAVVCIMKPLFLGAPCPWSDDVVEGISSNPKIAQGWHKDKYPKSYFNDVCLIASTLFFAILCHSWLLIKNHRVSFFI